MIQGNQLVEFINVYSAAISECHDKEESDWPFDSIFMTDNIPTQMLETAKELYATYENETPVLFVNLTFFRAKGRDSLLITDKNIYLRLINRKTRKNNCYIFFR